MFSGAEREHSPAHRLPGRTEGGGQASGEERSRHQLPVPGENPADLNVLQRPASVRLMGSSRGSSAEWLHAAVHGRSGESPGGCAVPAGERWEPKHRHRGRLSADTPTLVL